MGFTPVNVVARSQFASQPAGPKYSEGATTHILPAVGAVLPPAEPKRCVLPGHLQHPVNTTGAQQTSNPWMCPQTKTRASHSLDVIPEYPIDMGGRRFVNGAQTGYTVHPTVEEFDSLIDYIESLSPLGHKFGIIKIVPPQGKALTSDLDSETFWFHGERQCTNLSTEEEYNELASSFMKALVRFMDVHKKSQKLPTIDKRPVDLYRLWQSVSSHGGYDNVGKCKLWARIGRELGYVGRVSPSLSTSLRTAYNKCIAPFLEHLAAHNVNVHAARLVRFGVVDGSFEPQRGVKVLPEGITIEMEFLESCFKVQSYQPRSINDWIYGKASKSPANEVPGPAYNLRQFQQKADTIREFLLGNENERNNTERAFWSILERGEHIMTERGKALGELPNIDFLAKLPYASNSALRYAEDGSEYLTLPEVEVPMVFSCTTWHRSDLGAHRLVYNRAGAPITWYSSSKSYCSEMELPAQNSYAIDQEPGDIVVIFPSAVVSNFSHGFSITESIQLLTSDWLVPMPRMILPFSYEQLLVRILETCPERKLLASASSGLRAWLAFFMSLTKPNHIRFAEETEPKVMTCHETGAKMYLAWWETDVGPMSLSAGKGGTLVTRGDIPKCVNELIQQAENQIAKIDLWESQVTKYLGETPRPAPSDIYELAINAPDAPETLGPTLNSLKAMSEAASAWDRDVHILTEQAHSTDENWRTLDQQQKQLDCFLAPPAKFTELYDETKTFAAQVDNILRTKDWQALVSMNLKPHVINGYAQLFQQLHTRCMWLSQAIKEVTTAKPTLQKLEQLLQKAAAYGFDQSSPIMLRLKELHSTAVSLSQSLRNLLQRRVDEIADSEVEAALSAVTTSPVVVDECVNLINFANFRHFVRRIEYPSPDMLQRPRLTASRRIALNSPLAAQTVNQTVQWLAALGIDWAKLEVQARCLQLNAAPPHPLMMVSIQALRQLPDQLQMLAVEPDNLETILAVIQVVQQPYTVEMLASYGFIS